MDESNFDRLLERYVTGQVTAQEKRKIEAWLEVRKTRGEENTSLTAEEEQELFSKIVANIDNEKEIRSIRPIEAVRKSRRIWTLGIAASVMLLVAVAVAVTFKQIQPPGAITERIILKDGSIVWLRGESTFDYTQSPDGTRNGILDGEGLFEIAKDPFHPFHIAYKGFTITVVGTSFNLKTANDSLELKVFTGKVHVTSTGDSTGVMLERLESIQLTAGSPILKTSFDEKSINDLAADTQYDMNFSNTDMKSVTERLSAKFDVEFKFSNNKIGNCVVTADFTDRSLESTTEMLADVLNATFSRNGSTIYIEGSGCQ